MDTKATAIIQEARNLCEKFIKKVESGRARSIETYSDCGALLEMIKSYPNREESAGEEFMQEVRSIVKACSEYETPEKAARLTAFSILVMLDGSGEHIGNQYRAALVHGSNAVELIEFFHHDL